MPGRLYCSKYLGKDHVSHRGVIFCSKNDFLHLKPIFH